MPENNRYRKDRELSRSGIAEVWEGYDTELGRKVLIKSIHPQLVLDPDIRARFVREARAIARLSHRNVVRIYDLLVDVSDLSLILEWIQGFSLTVLIQKHGKLPSAVATAVTVEILEGLESAHQSEIIHRDLKPDNVLISDEGVVKITDFGLATLKDQPTMTQEGMVLGTPAYMAPEQAVSHGISNRTDLFAVGLMLFEMMTGRRLIEGQGHLEVLNNVIQYREPKLTSYGSLIPSPVIPVLAGMLARDPDKRFETAGEAREGLTAVFPGSFDPSVVIQNCLSGKEPLEGMEPVDSAGTGTARRTKVVWFAAAVLVAAVAVVIGFWEHLRPGEAERVSEGLLPDSLTEAPVDESRDTVAEMSGGDIIQDSIPLDIIPVPVSRESASVSPAVSGETGRTEPPAEETVIPSQAVRGRLWLTTQPWAQVFINDSLWGETPLAGPLTLDEGMYNVVLLNPEIGIPISRSFRVEPEKDGYLDVNLYDFVARIRPVSIKPWADIYINGVLELRTPSSKTVFRPLGRYQITLKNPSFPDYNEEVFFKQGDPPYEIRVDLTQL